MRIINCMHEKLCFSGIVDGVLAPQLIIRGIPPVLASTSDSQGGESGG
jgi:hypothetical protein